MTIKPEDVEAAFDCPHCAIKFIMVMALNAGCPHEDLLTMTMDALRETLGENGTALLTSIDKATDKSKLH